MCQTLAPGSECGAHGTCVAELCTCADGWSQSKEFMFFLDKDFHGVDEATLVCDTNEALLKALYSIALILMIIGVSFYGLSIRKFRQFKRLVPYFSVQACYILVTITKLVDLKRIVGEDPLVTTLFGIMLFFMNISLHVFLNKYLAAQFRVLKVKNAGLLKSIKLVEKAMFGTTFSSVVMVIFFFCIPFIDRGIEALGRIGFFLAGGSSLFIAIANLILLQKLIDDIGFVYRGGASSTQSEGQAELGEKILLNMKRVKWATFVNAFSNAVMFLGALFWDNWMAAWKYLLPVMMIISNVGTSTVVLLNVQNKKLIRKNTSTNPATNASFKPAGKMSANSFNDL